LGWPGGAGGHAFLPLPASPGPHSRPRIPLRDALKSSLSPNLKNLKMFLKLRPRH